MNWEIWVTFVSRVDFPHLSSRFWFWIWTQFQLLISLVNDYDYHINIITVMKDAGYLVNDIVLPVIININHSITGFERHWKISSWQFIDHVVPTKAMPRFEVKREDYEVGWVKIHYRIRLLSFPFGFSPFILLIVFMLFFSYVE